MSQKRPSAVYLLSLWQSHTEGAPAWRAWLECPSTGERRGFATLDELYGYLKIRLSQLECEFDAGLDHLAAAEESAGPPADRPFTA